MKKVNFLIQCDDKLIPTDGYYIGKRGGFELIAHRSHMYAPYWIVSELHTGARVIRSSGFTTRKAAISEAHAIIDTLEKEQIARAHELMRDKAVNTLSVIK